MGRSSAGKLYHNGCTPTTAAQQYGKSKLNNRVLSINIVVGEVSVKCICPTK